MAGPPCPPGVRLCSLRGGIPAYASSSLFVSSSYERGGTETDWRIKDPDHLREECRRYVREGFRAVKFGWGNHFSAADEERSQIAGDGLDLGEFGHGDSVDGGGCRFKASGASASVCARTIPVP